MKEKDSKTILQKIRDVVLNEDDKDLKLAEMQLEDGKTIFAESFEAGESVYLLEGEERIALPVGEYMLADGKVLIVAEEGMIDSITMPEAEEAPAETEASESESKEEELKQEDLEAVEKLKAENESLKNELEAKMAKKEAEPKRASKGIKASPEGKTELALNNGTDSMINMIPAQRIALSMQNTPFYDNVKLATTTSMTTTYAGEFAGQYIAAASLQGTTLGAQAITIKPNIKLKEVVKKIATTDLLKDASCDFDPTGTVTLTERILSPKELQVNLELCKSTFKSDWDAISMGYSAFDVLPPNFQAYFVQKMAEIINASIETSIWHGVEATDGQFGGFVPLMTADADVVDEAGTTVTAANVIAELGTVVDKIPQSVYGEPDMTIYVAPNVYRAYVRALGGFAASGVGAAGTNAQGTQWYNGGSGLSFDGIPIFMTNGLSSNYMVAAQASNLWYGTGLLNDNNEVKVLDMADVDGSKNVRFVMRFTGGVQYGVGSEIVLYTPA